MLTPNRPSDIGSSPTASLQQFAPDLQISPDHKNWWVDDDPMISVGEILQPWVSARKAETRKPSLPRGLLMDGDIPFGLPGYHPRLMPKDAQGRRGLRSRWVPVAHPLAQAPGCFPPPRCWSATECCPPHPSKGEHLARDTVGGRRLSGEMVPRRLGRCLAYNLGDIFGGDSKYISLLTELGGLTCFVFLTEPILTMS